jgi:hypothetical protein
MPVRKQLEKALQAATNAKQRYEDSLEFVDFIINDICDFDAKITHCAGDGLLVLNLNTANVATLDCLKGKHSKNLLTEEEHDRMSL